MSPRVGSSLGIALVIGFLATLAILPTLLNKRTFKIAPYSSGGKAPVTFPLDRPFPLLETSGTKIKVARTTTLKELMEKEGHRSLLINFWATWCPPCVAELPQLEYLNRELTGKKDSKLPLVITISVDEGTKEIATLFKTLDFKPSLRVLYDKGGAFSTAMGTTKFPETYWVSAEGKVLYKWLGPQDWLSSDVLHKIADSLQVSARKE